MRSILISGAGIAGLALARQLQNKGLPFTIIEKKPTLNTTGTGIALPANAVRALRYMGLSQFVDAAHQVTDIIYAKPSGRVLSQASLLTSPLNLDKFIAVERSELLAVLKQGIEEHIHFDTHINELSQTEDGVDICLSNPSLNGRYQGVVGADGIHSNVRHLAMGASELVDLGVTNWRWICHYPTQDLQPTYMIGSKNIFLAYPIGKNRIYCYAHQADPDGQFNQPDKARQHLKTLFSRYKGIAAPLLNMLSEKTNIYTGRLQSVPKPFFSLQHVALIGDAANACSPMLQQGAACAFEDAIVLSEFLAKNSMSEACKLYQSHRDLRVNWIVKTSDDSIRAFINNQSPLSIVMRNAFIRFKGPLNVLGWKHLLSSCPIEQFTADCQ